MQRKNKQTGHGPMKKRYAWILAAAAALQAGAAAGQIHFTNVGSATNTLVRCNTHGSGFFDIDADGWDDIFVVHNTSLGEYTNLPNTLLKNLTYGMFQNITDAAAVQGYLSVSAQGMAAADYNNDGRMDMCIGMGNRYYQALLYRQNSDRTFADISSWAITGRGTMNGRCLSFMDYNNDGWVDLLVLKDDILDDPSDFCLSLYRNKQNGAFENVAVQAGLNFAPAADDLYGFAVADADNDGDPDVYVPRLSGASLFLRNDQGVFHEISTAAGLPHGPGYLGAVFLDTNNDGYWDLFLKRQNAPVQLFVNDGDGTFTDVSAAAGLSGVNTGLLPEDSAFGGGLTTADFDNDGWADILVTNRYGSRNKLLRNNGNGTFTECASSAGLAENIDYYWTTPVADYDRDGYLDIYMARSPGGTPSIKDAALYRNNGGSGRWCFVRLTGSESNRSAIGARLEAWVNGGLQIRQVLGGDGYKVNSFWTHFGLGAAETIDSLIVKWPGGMIQKGTEIPAGTFLEMTEKDTVQYYGPPYIAGTIGHFKSGAPLPGVHTVLTGDASGTTDTDPAGRYRLKPVPRGTVNLTVTPSKTRGDDLRDGVTAFDAALTLRSVAGLENLSDTQKLEADADGDGSISALDAAFIARCSVGMLDDAPSIAGSWRFTPASRAYANIPRELEMQDFQCLLLGDVTENWGDPEVPGKAGEPAGLTCPGDFPAGRETVEIPLSFDGKSPMLAADVWMRFDPAALDFQGAFPAGPASGFELISNTESPGFVKIALYGSHPTATGGDVLRVRFLAIRGAPPRTTIQWEKIAVNENGLRTGATSLSLTERATGEKPASFGIRGNFPNPFNPGTTVVYSAGSESETSLAIYDTKGRRVRVLAEGRQNPGETKAAWDGLDDRGMEAPPGLYLCRLTSGKLSRVIKLVKVK
jgi:hypothetical protein